MPKKPNRNRRRYPWKKRADPWPFLFAAAKLPGKALHVADALLRLAYLAECRTVEWQHAVGEQMGLNYPAFYRGLKALERARLVAVDRRNGRCPVVTILEPKP